MPFIITNIRLKDKTYVASQNKILIIPQRKKRKKESTLILRRGLDARKQRNK